jgi:hypothetical protein
MKRIVSLFLVVLILAVTALPVSAEGGDLTQWAQPIKGAINRGIAYNPPSKPYVAYFFSHPGTLGSVFVEDETGMMAGSIVWALCSDSEIIRAGDTVDIYFGDYTVRRDDFYTITLIGEVNTITQLMHTRSDDGRLAFDATGSLQGYYRADYYLEDISTARIENTYDMPSSHIVRLWNPSEPPPESSEPPEPPEPPPGDGGGGGVALSPEMLEPVLDSMKSAIAVILPIGLALLALFLCISLVRRYLRKYAK